MSKTPRMHHWRLSALICVGLSLQQTAFAQSRDYFSFAEGVVPVRVGGDAEALRLNFEQALLVIDGDHGKVVLTPKPGAADTEVTLVYRLPALTIFSAFAVPAISETPSPSQTFFREIEVAGSDTGPDAPFEPLAGATLAVHAGKDELTRLPVARQKPVLWIQLTLRGGINVEREQTFFEFSELIGEGEQQPVPLLETFGGKWQGRGVLLELHQDGTTVSGCYDRIGDLRGTVSGNLLRATGAHRSSGVPSVFLLTVTDDGELTGVRSTNDAPFRLMAGAPAPALTTECSEQTPRAPTCGDTVHGIQFDFDSAVIRPDSAAVLDSLYAGLKDVDAAKVRIVGHTSSEGAADYNLELSGRRAAAVVAALVERGIEPARLLAQGEGEASPIADNSSEAGRSLNRRVEIRCL